MERKGLTQESLAAILKRPRPTISEIMNGKKSITPEMARDLGRVFDTGPHYWLRLEMDYRLALIPHDTSEVGHRLRLHELAPIKEMEKRGWIPANSSDDVLENELKKFFDVDSLESEPPVCADARKANPEAPIDRVQRAWIARARQLASAIATPPFNLARGPELLEKLRRLAAYPKEASEVCDLLFRFGIRFVIVQPLENSNIDGAAFWVNGSPAIALSLRHGRIDAFWFTLIHEVAHILNNDAASIDSDMAGAEQLPSRMKVDIERRADEMAANTLIPSEELNKFITMFSPLYSKTRVIQFAHRIKMHPGIIVGQLQHRAEMGWNAGRQMLVDIRDHVISTALTDGWGRTISPGTLD
jgi:HTH-type transcriptional regulator/antitoxin HigA